MDRRGGVSAACQFWFGLSLKGDSEKELPEKTFLQIDKVEKLNFFPITSQLNTELKRKVMIEDIEMFSYQIIFPGLQNVFFFKKCDRIQNNDDDGEKHSTRTNEETKTK